jgi:alpha-glucosidase
VKKLLFILLLILTVGHAFCGTIDLYSPDKRIKLSVSLNNKISYSVRFNGDALLSGSYLQLNLDNQSLGSEPSLIRKTFSVINTTSNPVVPLKNKVVTDNCNLLRLDFKNNFTVEFRAYNNGVAYRFITNKKDSIIVKNEDAHFSFSDNTLSFFSQANSFICDYQILYARKWLKDIDSSKMSVLPILLDNQKYKVTISEADLYDYPCMFLKGTGGNALDAIFPKVPAAYGPDGDRSLKIIKEQPYIAKTAGKRAFPWRFMLITDRIRKSRQTSWCITWRGRLNYPIRNG